jgi:hypothetical protein
MLIYTCVRCVSILTYTGFFLPCWGYLVSLAAEGCLLLLVVRILLVAALDAVEEMYVEYVVLGAYLFCM